LNERRAKQIVLCLLMLLLVVAVARTNYGIWNSDVPLGDESSYVGQSYSLLQEGSFSRNVYLDCYLLCYKFVDQDPIVAYYCLRFTASLLSVAGLFLLLSSLNSVSPFGAFAMALLWNLNLLTTPVIQYANISLFAFALACFAGYLWLSDFRKGAKLLSLVILLAAASARVEYLLLLALIGAQRGALWCVQLKGEGWSGKRLVQLGAAAGAVLIPAGAVALSAHHRNSASQLFHYLDNYLFLGLKQCYTGFLVARDPGLGLEPMTEFDTVMNTTFPGASGFSGAVSVNPLEIARYFFLNASYNLAHLHYLLPTHSTILPTGLAAGGLAKGRQLHGYYLLWAEQIVMCLGIAMGGIWLLTTKFSKFKPSQLWKTDSLFFIASLAAVSVTALLLLIPAPHYWISVIPLLFWGPAALISRYSTMRNRRTMICLSVLLSFVFVSPVFTSSLNGAAHKHKDLVLSLREKLAQVGKTPVNALGVFPYPLLSFAIPGRGQSTSNMEVRKGSSYEALVKSKENDLVIVDAWLTGTQQYKKEQAFFERFLKNPEVYGYEPLLVSEQQDGPVYIFLRSKAKW